MESFSFIDNQTINEIEFHPDWRKWTATTGKSYMQWLSYRELRNKVAAKERGHFVPDETIERLRRILQASD